MKLCLLLLIVVISNVGGQVDQSGVQRRRDGRRKSSNNLISKYRRYVKLLMAHYARNLPDKYFNYSMNLSTLCDGQKVACGSIYVIEVELLPKISQNMKVECGLRHLLS